MIRHHLFALTLLFSASGAGPATLDLTVSRMDAGGNWVALVPDGSGRLLVLPCWRIRWEVTVQVPDDGIANEGGLAGVSFDLTTDLRESAPSFSLYPAINLSRFSTWLDLDVANPSFRNFVSVGTVIDFDAMTPKLSTLQGVGAVQDVIDLVTPGSPNGVVVADVAEGGPVVVAHGTFSVPSLTPGTIFQLYTGGVPGNPGQTRVAQLEGPPVASGQFDNRWPLASSLAPVHIHGETSPIEFIVDSATLEIPVLVNICDAIGYNPGGGAPRDIMAFISPIAYNVLDPFDWFPILFHQEVTLDPLPPPVLNSTGGIVPAVQGLTFDYDTGNHVLQLTGGVQYMEWTGIQLTVENACGQSKTVCMHVAHLPCDNNGDRNVTPGDAGAFATEFNDLKRLLLTDINDDGDVTPGDAGAWMTNFIGRTDPDIPKADGTFIEEEKPTACTFP